MKNKLTSSVVLGTYNGEEYLEQQIDSIINQTVLPEEIIFVDDCSTDQTITIINSYQDIFKKKSISVSIFKQKKNVGYIQNFLSGIGEATGDIIFLSDQDDIWLPNKIQNYLEMFENNKKILALHGNTNLIDKKNNVIEENFQNYNQKLEQISLKKFIKKVNYPGMALAFRNKNFKNKILDPSLTKKLPTHDWYICLIASLDDGLYITDQILTLRRYTENNVALRLNNKRISDVDNRIEGIKVYDKCYNLLKRISSQLIFSNSVNIDKYIENNRKRINYLENKSLIKGIINIVNIKYYPTIKAYFGDIILLIK